MPAALHAPPSGARSEHARLVASKPVQRRRIGLDDADAQAEQELGIGIDPLLGDEAANSRDRGERRSLAPPESGERPGTRLGAFISRLECAFEPILRRVLKLPGQRNSERWLRQ